MNIKPTHNQIGDKAFDLFLMGMKRLRGKYRAIRIDLPNGMIMTAKRKFIIELLLVEEFGEKAIDNYRAQINEWEQARVEATGKLNDDDRFLPPTVKKLPTVSRPIATPVIPSQTKNLHRTHGA